MSIMRLLQVSLLCVLSIAAAVGCSKADGTSSGPVQAALMSRGDIDAAWTPEPWGSRLIAEQGATLIAEEKDLWPSHEFVLTVVVTTPDFLEAHRDLVEKILRVHRTWTDRLNKEP